MPNHIVEIHSDKCIGCGQCTAVCPKEAVTISGYDSQPIPSGKADIRYI